MQEGLLLVERIVIESLAKKEKNLYELSLDTSLNHAILLNILPNLIMNNLIHYSRGSYSLNKEKYFLWGNSINQKKNLKEEVKEIFANLVNQSFAEEASSTEVKVKKIWLSKEEEKQFKVIIRGLDFFIENLKNKRREQVAGLKTGEETVILWGYSKYSQLIDSALRVG